MNFFGGVPFIRFRLDLFEGKMILDNGPLTGGFRDANPEHNTTTTYPTGTRMGLLSLYLTSTQTFQVSKFEVLTYISCMDTAYLREPPPKRIAL